jgi:hypothetical protein
MMMSSLELLLILARDDVIRLDGFDILPVRLPASGGMGFQMAILTDCFFFLPVMIAGQDFSAAFCTSDTLFF